MDRRKHEENLDSGNYRRRPTDKWKLDKRSYKQSDTNPNRFLSGRRQIVRREGKEETFTLSGSKYYQSHIRDLDSHRDQRSNLERREG